MIKISSPSIGCLEEAKESIAKVLASGTLTLGSYTSQLEEIIKNYLQVKHVVAVSSWTAGMMLVLKALDKKGEVILPSFTFSASVLPILWNECVPTFADCNEDYFDISTSEIESLISTNTIAIMPVYAYGAIPHYEEIKKVASKHNLLTISDAAQAMGGEAQGKKAGSLFDVEVFSLSPSKNLTGAEGGIIATNNDDIAKKVLSLRNYGKSLADNFTFESVGLSSRLSEINAALAVSNFKYLTQFLSHRKFVVDSYKSRLAKLGGIKFQEHYSEHLSSNNYFPIFLDPKNTPLSRDELHTRLQNSDIETRRYFYPCSHEMPAFLGTYRSSENLKNSLQASREVLCLPIGMHIGEEQIEFITSKISDLLN